jgi:hypothetical protein
MNFLRQSTAVDIGLGPFVDATDGVTAETALTISQADVRLKKNNGAWAQANESTSATHEENGWYEKPLDATDTNTVGILLVAVNESGALPVWREFQVVEEAVYDRDYAAAGTGIVGTAQTGDSFARLGAPAGASVSADVAAVKVDTAAILVDTGTTLDGRIPAALVSGRMDCSVGAMAANVMTAAAAAADLTTELQSGLATAAALATVDGIVDDILLDTAEIGAAGAGLTVLATQASVNTIDDLLDTEIPALTTAVADLPTNAELATALGTADDAVLAAIAALNNISTAQVNTEVDTAIQDAFNFSNGNVNANVEEINTVTITGDGQVGTEFGV